MDPQFCAKRWAFGEEDYERAKVGSCLLKPPFEIRQQLEKPELILGIRIGLDAQAKRWAKGEHRPASVVEINAAAERKPRWGAKEYRGYCRYSSFEQKWKSL